MAAHDALFGSHFAQERQQLLALLPQQTRLAARPLARYMAAHTALVDAHLQRLWQHFPLLDTQACLCAVGGYGRQEFAPYSDIDVLLLLPPAASAALQEAAAAFLSACWDAGLEIAASTRTVAECVQAAQDDISTQTAMLESRYLNGLRRLYQDFQAACQQALDPLAFFHAKSSEMRQRHEKFNHTPYELEPNCKESPGGLRDLQVLLWVIRASMSVKTWRDLVPLGLATALEARQLQKNWVFLSTIRCHLHALAGRREDRLLFDYQHQLAQKLGFAPAAGTPSAQPARRPSEALMREYYWAAKAVTQLNQIILLNVQGRLQGGAQEAMQPINARFADKGGLLEVQSDDLYQREPQAILETFYLYQTTPGLHGLSARTLRALYNARALMGAKFRNDPANHAMFLRILQAPSGITHVLRLMNQTSVLGRYLWVFRHTVGQMQHDLFHVYTVDQHILMVLRNVRRFFLPEHAHEYPYCSQLAAGWRAPWILWVAALFHDIGKGRGGDHSDLGARDVRQFCKQHGIAADDQALIVFLVREHLTMSTVAQKKDLSNPQVIADFAALVGSERYLTGLYLLTVADIRGTSPKVWTAWKGKLLEDLYRRTLAVLGGSAADPKTELESRKKQALDTLALLALPQDAQAQLWQTLDVSYFLRHEPSEIAWHTRVLSKLMAQHPYFAQLRAVAKKQMLPARDKPIEGSTVAPVFTFARTSPVGEGLQVLVYGPDQHDLFARICAYFERASLSIVDAKIYTAPNGWVLDTFELTTLVMPEHYRELLTMVEADLAQSLNARKPLPEPMRGRTSRRVKHFPLTPRVSLEPDETGENWLLSVACADRLGLLYDIARVLAEQGVNLQSAKIMTLGERVEDTFLLNGANLRAAVARAKLEADLLKTISRN